MPSKLRDTEQQDFFEKEHKFRHRSYNHPVIKLFAQQRINYLSRYVDFSQVSSALDVGCGAGFSSHYFSQITSNIIGLDRSKRMLSQNPLSKKRLIQGDACVLPFKDNSFDFVYSWESLHHISDPLAVVNEMSRVSSRYVVIFEPNRNNPLQALFAIVDRPHRWVLRYSTDYMKQLAQKAGLNIIKSTTVGCILPNKTPAFLVSFLKQIPFEIPLIGISHLLICKKAFKD